MHTSLVKVKYLEKKERRHEGTETQEEKTNQKEKGKDFLSPCKRCGKGDNHQSMSKNYQDNRNGSQVNGRVS